VSPASLTASIKKSGTLRASPNSFRRNARQQCPLPFYRRYEKSGDIAGKRPNSFRCNARQQCPLPFYRLYQKIGDIAGKRPNFVPL
jgi:hypothetical protein